MLTTRRLRAAPLVLFLTFGLGCQSRYFETDAGLATTDAPPGADAAGGGSDLMLPRADATLPPADQRQTPPDAVCLPTGGPEICNGRDDDCDGTVDDVDPATLNDVLACGSCDVVCANPPNAVARCSNKACVYECQSGAVDIDKGMVNGCECLVTATTEVCDGRDNECNGIVDDGFDVTTDVNNCGVCNKRCIFPYAQATCVAGSCVMGACLSGFFDRDRDSRNGCEVACSLSNGGAEICDGVDNDCDGQTDEGVTPTVQCKGMGVCAGAKPSCERSDGWVCSYNADYQDAETVAKGCDGKDNDCDGQIDEAFDVGKACSVGLGGCASAGVLVCDATDRTKTRCSAVAKAPGMERCNGIDDDCDGKVDELESITQRTVDDKLIYVSGPDVTIFAYEASRPDATDKAAGADSGGRPCSVTGRLPWANVTQGEATKACQAIGTGWRLCTKDEWFAACRGTAMTVFPYGNTYNAMTCNGWDYVPTTERDKDVTTVAVGAAAQCKSNLGSAGELFDMSGNLKEWVFSSAATASPSTYELRGGAYNIASFGGTAPGLQCDAAVPAPADLDVRLPSVGFRCCREGMLP